MSKLASSLLTTLTFSLLPPNSLPYLPAKHMNCSLFSVRPIQISGLSLRKIFFFDFWFPSRYNALLKNFSEVAVSMIIPASPVVGMIEADLKDYHRRFNPDLVCLECGCDNGFVAGKGQVLLHDFAGAVQRWKDCWSPV